MDHCIHDPVVFTNALVKEPTRVICKSGEIATIGSSVIFLDNQGGARRGRVVRLLKLHFFGVKSSGLANKAWAIVAPFEESQEKDAFGQVLIRLLDRYHIIPAKQIVQPFHAVHYCPSNPFCLGASLASPDSLSSSCNESTSPVCDPHLFSINQFRTTDPLPASCRVDVAFDPVPPLVVSLQQAQELARSELL